MSLFGSCDDCDRARQLRYKPDVPLDEQSRPSVCARCRDKREELLRDVEDHRYREGLPISYETGIVTRDRSVEETEEADRDE